MFFFCCCCRWYSVVCHFFFCYSVVSDLIRVYFGRLLCVWIMALGPFPTHSHGPRLQYNNICIYSAIALCRSSFVRVFFSLHPIFGESDFWFRQFRTNRISCTGFRRYCIPSPLQRNKKQFSILSKLFEMLLPRNVPRTQTNSPFLIEHCSSLFFIRARTIFFLSSSLVRK